MRYYNGSYMNRMQGHKIYVASNKDHNKILSTKMRISWLDEELPAY